MAKLCREKAGTDGKLLLNSTFLRLQKSILLFHATSFVCIHFCSASNSPKCDCGTAKQPADHGEVHSKGGWVLEFNQILAASLESQEDYYKRRIKEVIRMYAGPLAVGHFAYRCLRYLLGVENSFHSAGI